MDETLRKKTPKVDYRDPKIYKKYYHLVNWDGVSWPATLEDLNRIEQNNSNLAINLMLGPADAKDEIVKKRTRKHRKQTLGNKKGGRVVPEGVKKGKFKAVTNLRTIRTSKKNNREHVINLLMIHKVCFKKLFIFFYYC